MFRKKKNSQKMPAWRDSNGKINCPGDNCRQECDDTCPIWLNTCALEALTQSQTETAISRLRQAILLAPDFADAYSNLGSAYGMSNRHKEAYDAFSKALELREGYPQALQGLIIAEKNLGMYEDALRHCDQLEDVTTGSVETIREEIRSLMKRPTAEQPNWLALALPMLHNAKEKGYIQSDGFPNIPEILALAEETCEKIMQSMKEACVEDEQIDYFRLTLGWAAFAGMGAVYFWNQDWLTLSRIGIFETLTEERGLDEMDEFVLDNIGLQHDQTEAKDLSSYLNMLSTLCAVHFMRRGVQLDDTATVLGAKAMFAFGMVFEMNRLGMM